MTADSQEIFGTDKSKNDRLTKWELVRTKGYRKFILLYMCFFCILILGASLIGHIIIAHLLHPYDWDKTIDRILGYIIPVSFLSSWGLWWYNDAKYWETKYKTLKEKA